MALARCARSPSKVLEEDFDTLQDDVLLLRAAEKFKATRRSVATANIKTTEAMTAALLQLLYEDV